MDIAESKGAQVENLGHRPDLPYYCPRLGSSPLLSPCAGLVAAAKERRAMFPGALLGHLEQCLECKGKSLEVRGKPILHFEGKTRPGVELQSTAIAPPLPDTLPENEANTPLQPCSPPKLKPKKLPAWLGNASAAVRRDYLRERGKI